MDRLLFSYENYHAMSYEIQIDHKDDEIVSFTINDTPCQVEIEVEIGSEQYPVSYNSFTDDITYAESDTIYYHVKCETLLCAGIVYYNDKDLCTALEQQLNTI